MQNVRNFNRNLLSMNEDALTHLILYGDNTLTDNTSTFLLNSVIEYTLLMVLLFCNIKSNSTKPLLNIKIQFISDFCISFRF